MYDLLLKNAHVLDGTGSPAMRSDLAVKDGRIAAISPRLAGPAARTLDLHGLTVAPGFIDAHSHSDVIVEAFPECIAALEQGITTQIAGMCGQSAAPLSPEHLEDGLRCIRSLYAGPLCSPAAARFSFGGYLNLIDKPLGTSMAFLVGHGTLRASVMGFAERGPTSEDLSRMKLLLARSMEEGAMGISFGLIYPPGSYCDIDEMAALCTVVAEHGGVMTVHLRSESSGLVEAVEEMLEVTRRSGVRCVISHHKATGGPANWGKVQKTLALIDRANAEGLDVFCDQYPYTASATSLATNIPGRLHALGVPALLDLLSTPEGRAELRPLIIGDKTPEERFVYTMIGSSPSHPTYNGRMLNELARELERDPYELQCDLLLEDELLTGGIFHTMSEDDLRAVLRCKRAMVGTDGLWYPGCKGAHPRSIGTFPRVLGRYVREQGVLPLEEAIRKMTSLPAAVYSLKGKGLICIGFDADLVVFDPDTIADRADYVDFRARCVGLHYVFVRGKLAVENAVFTGTRAGSILRAT